MLSWGPPSESRTRAFAGAFVRVCLPVAGSVSHQPAAGSDSGIAPIAYGTAADAATATATGTSGA